MDVLQISEVLKQYKEGKRSLANVIKYFKWYPFVTLPNITLDTQRHLRKGFPEIIYAPGKDTKTLEKIIKNFREISPLIVTKLNYSVYIKLKKKIPRLKYNKLASIGYFVSPPKKRSGNVAVVSAGSSDINIAEESAFMLELLGIRVERFYDLGAAGLHRIMDKIERIQKARCIIVVAGMEGTLPGIVASMIAKPVIAVPTSIGYGTNFSGWSALLTMLNSCSLGLAVVNIDNGIGAATIAFLINKL